MHKNAGTQAPEEGSPTNVRCSTWQQAQTGGIEWPKFRLLPLVASSLIAIDSGVRELEQCQKRVSLTGERTNSHYRWKASRVVSAVGTGFPKIQPRAGVDIEWRGPSPYPTVIYLHVTQLIPSGDEKSNLIPNPDRFGIPSRSPSS